MDLFMDVDTADEVRTFLGAERFFSDLFYFLRLP